MQLCYKNEHKTIIADLHKKMNKYKKQAELEEERRRSLPVSDGF
jgi:dihydropteroate synthase